MIAPVSWKCASVSVRSLYLRRTRRPEAITKCGRHSGTAMYNRITAKDRHYTTEWNAHASDYNPRRAPLPPPGLRPTPKLSVENLGVTPTNMSQNDRLITLIAMGHGSWTNPVPSGPGPGPENTFGKPVGKGGRASRTYTAPGAPTVLQSG